MSENEIRALITLIDDPDEEVYLQVRDRIVSLGDDVVPVLERAWEYDDLGDLFRNRIDLTTDLDTSAALCHEVLAAIAAERDDQDAASAHLASADRLRGHAGIEVPGFQRGDAARTRAAIAT